MNARVVEIPPPHVVIGLVPFDGSERDSFMAACQLILNAGAAFVGRAEVMERDAVPPYELLSDLADQTEMISPESLSDLEAWDPLRIWFQHPKTGRISVSYSPVRGSSPHPVAVTVSGESLDAVKRSAPTNAESDQAMAVREFVTRVFRSICGELEPIYAAIQVEDDLPAPGNLLADGASVGTNLFVSKRVIDTAPQLVAQLTGVFDEGTTRHVPNGFLVADSFLLDPTRSRTINAVAKGRAAAKLLGQVLSVDPPQSLGP